MELLCSCNATFWNSKEFWNSSVPIFSRCWLNTVPSFVSAIFIWIFAPYHIYCSSQRVRRSTIPYSPLIFGRMILVAAIVVLNFIHFAVELREWNTKAENENDKSSQRSDANKQILAEVLSPLTNVFGYTIFAILLYANRYYAIHASPIAATFTALSVVLQIPVIYMSAAVAPPPLSSRNFDSFRVSVSSIHFVTLCVLCVTTCFADRGSSNGNRFHDRLRASEAAATQEDEMENLIDQKAVPLLWSQISFLSRLTGWWANGLMSIGYHRATLRIDDLWHFDLSRYSASVIAHRFDRYWCADKRETFRDQLRSINEYKRENEKDNYDDQHHDHDADDDIHCHGKHLIGSRAMQTADTIWALMKTFRLKLFCTGLAQFFDIVAQLATPFLLKNLLDFVARRDDNDRNEPTAEPSWHGAFFALALIIACFAQSSARLYVNHSMRIVRMKCRSALISTVYRKLFILHNGLFDSKFTAKHIVEMMTIDADRIADSIGRAHQFWSTPLIFVLALYFLAIELSVTAALAGTTMTFVLAAFGSAFRDAEYRLERRRSSCSEQRIQNIVEIFRSILQIKLNGIEVPLIGRITTIRDAELRWIALGGYTQAIGTVFACLAAYLVPLATFAVFVANPQIYPTPTDHDKSDHHRTSLDPTKAFVSLLLLDMLRSAVERMPKLWHTIVRAHHADKRLNRYLSSENLCRYRTWNESRSSAAIEITDYATFAWESWIAMQSTFVLSCINLRVDSGSLVAIVGERGVGKSSLLAAINGDLELLDGRLNVAPESRIIRLTQRAWIRSGATVRENILFGDSYDETRYDAVIDACALRADFERFADGDLTRIATFDDEVDEVDREDEESQDEENGMKKARDGAISSSMYHRLTGSQSQRIALARACYHRAASIVLLDDPLSAVDSQLAQQIFDQVIGKRGFLRHRTRVLVTNNIRFLQAVGEIIVLANGTVYQRGTYQKLMDANGKFAHLVRDYLARLPENSDQTGCDSNDDAKDQCDDAITADAANSDEHRRRQSSHDLPESIIEKHHDNNGINNDDDVGKNSILPNSKSSMTMFEDDARLRGTSSTVRRVRPKCYYTYFSSLTSICFVAAIVCFMLRGAFSVVTDMALVYWTTEIARFDAAKSSKMITLANSSSSQINSDLSFFAISSTMMTPTTTTTSTTSTTTTTTTTTTTFPATSTIIRPIIGGVNLRNAPPDQLLLLAYGAAIGAQAIILAIGTAALATGSLRSCTALHRRAIERLMRTPISYLESIPIRALTRVLSRDIAILDRSIAFAVCRWIIVGVQLSCIVAWIVVQLPLATLAAIPLAWFAHRTQRLYIISSRQFAALESAAADRAVRPHVRRTFAGIVTIRAYAQASIAFIAEINHLIDTMQRAAYARIVADRWRATRFAACGLAVIAIVAFTVAAQSRHESLGSAYVGLLLWYALQFDRLLTRNARRAAEVERSMASVERIDDLCRLSTEREWIRKRNEAPYVIKQWPLKGKIEIRKLSTICADEPTANQAQKEEEEEEDGEDVSRSRKRNGETQIRDLTLDIHAGEKISIIGPRHAGKSTLLRAMFRIAEATDGKIQIDGIEISRIGLHELRQRLAIIPRDPILFSGTVRSNLDPFEQYSDATLWTVLQATFMRRTIESLDGGLDHVIEGTATGSHQASSSQPNEIFTVGERKLLALARAAIRRSKVLIVDERRDDRDTDSTTTPEIDALIQRTIREQFAESTVLLITDRITSIIDSDRTLVLERGSMVEFDDPAALLADRRSRLYRFVKQRV